MNATDVLELYWDGTLPVDPIKIAEKVGIKLYDKNINNDLGGYIHNKITPEIHVNNKLNETCKRFAIAHMLGHFFLGHDINIEQDDNDYGKGEL